jgi:hypothetical protein
MDWSLQVDTPIYGMEPIVKKKHKSNIHPIRLIRFQKKPYLKGVKNDR